MALSTNISSKEFRKGVLEYERHEKRDAMYKVATFLVRHFWGNPSNMADGLGVLLLTWNQACYRYGSFDFEKLDKCIADNFQKIESFRNREILSLSNSDDDNIKDLFSNFLEALQIDEGEKKGTKSPVAVAKALHVLAPDFFPLWDAGIAEAYECNYYKNNPAEKYVSFCHKARSIVNKVKDYIKCLDKSILKLVDSNKSILKLVDEYNYSKYTKRWV